MSDGGKIGRFHSFSWTNSSVGASSLFSPEEFTDPLVTMPLIVTVHKDLAR